MPIIRRLIWLRISWQYNQVSFNGVCIRGYRGLKKLFSKICKIFISITWCAILLRWKLIEIFSGVFLWSWTFQVLTRLNYTPRLWALYWDRVCQWRSQDSEVRGHIDILGFNKSCQRQKQTTSQSEWGAAPPPWLCQRRLLHSIEGNDASVVRRVVELLMKVGSFSMWKTEELLKEPSYTPMYSISMIHCMFLSFGV